MGALADSITLDDLTRDPYPIYRELRRHEPVAWLSAAGVWIVTRWVDVEHIGRDRVNWVGAAGHPTLERVFGRPNVLTADGEIHLDQRAGIGASLTPKAVHGYIDTRLRPIAARYAAGLRGRTEIDLNDEFFEPVSVEALGQIMGLNDLVDPDTLRRWFRDLSDGLGNFDLLPAGFARADAASAEIDALLVPALDRLRSHPDDSMLSNMIHHGRDDRSARTDAEVLPSLKVLLLGGMQEPGHGGASTMLGLLERLEQLAAVVADHDLIPAAVTEGYRWIAPIGAVERQAVGDQRVAGVDLPDGSIIELMLASANRDETRFADPDTFDIFREPIPHMAFGNGAHYCSGHYFSRLLEKVMFEELLPVIGEARLDPDRPPVVDGWFFRGAKSLPVLVEHA